MLPSNQGDIRYATPWIPLILGAKVLHNNAVTLLNAAKSLITLDLRNCCSKERLSTVPWCFLLSFISLSSSNRLQKGEKLAKGANKLIGKTLTYLLRHAISRLRNEHSHRCARHRPTMVSTQAVNTVHLSK